MIAEKSTTSEIIHKLQQAVEAGNENAAAIFWDQASKQGTPIIEKIPEEPEYSLVTFLWRSREIDGVSLISLLTNPTTYPMSRMMDTDLWYLSVPVRKDIRATYQFIVEDSQKPMEEAESPISRFAKYQKDPHNSRTFDFFTEDEDPMGVKFTRSVLVMPEAGPQPWTRPRDGVPNGKVEVHHVRSDILGNERRVWVYTPTNYENSGDETYPILILFDGWAYAHLIPTFTILDNLISEGQIPPVIAVLPDSLSNETRIRELIYHQPFNEFLVSELLPWLREYYPVTSNPGGIILGGSSAGGLAAAFAAVENPDMFGNVLAQSGAFSFSPKGDDEPEWLSRQLAMREGLPIKFHIDAGILEVNSLRDRGDDPSLLTTTRHLRDVLLAKGYEFNYAELRGGHDYISWRGSLAEGLTFLFGDEIR